jgi:DNA protecting protein DprA
MSKGTPLGDRIVTCRSRSGMGSRRQLMAAIRLSRLPGVGARQFQELIRRDPDPVVALRMWRQQRRKPGMPIPPPDRQDVGSACLPPRMAAPNASLGQGKRADRQDVGSACLPPRMAAPNVSLGQGKRTVPAKSATRPGIAAAAAWLKSGAGHGAFAGGAGYPATLLDLSEPPPVLFWRSPLRARLFADDWWLCREWVAIVGSRRPSADAADAVTGIVSSLSGESHGIISGGARGIDACSHRLALVAGIPSVAVLGSGVDIVYPREHEELFAELAKTGGLLSELLPGTAPRPGFFPTRNRLIAALADRVIVVQAGNNSGALITARWARRLGRRLEVLLPPPGAECDPDWGGNAYLLATGAIPIRA